MRTLLFLVLVTLFAFACNKENESFNSNETPACIRRKIEQFKKDQPQQLSVWQYEYDGMTVYYIPGQGCMRLGELYDSNCNLICHPDGGFTGMGDGKCDDFFKKRKNEKLIWKDERQYIFIDTAQAARPFPSAIFQLLHGPSAQSLP